MPAPAQAAMQAEIQRQLGFADLGQWFRESMLDSLRTQAMTSSPDDLSNPLFLLARQKGKTPDVLLRDLSRLFGPLRSDLVRPQAP